MLKKSEEGKEDLNSLLTKPTIEMSNKHHHGHLLTLVLKQLLERHLFPVLIVYRNFPGLS